MSKIQHLHLCPDTYNIKVATYIHYNVFLEDGTQYNICSDENMPVIIKCVELLHICNNLFDIKPNYDKCGYIPDWILFPDKSYVCVNSSLVYYYVNENIRLFNTPDLYELLDYLKKLYPNLMLPLKIGISH